MLIYHIYILYDSKEPSENPAVLYVGKTTDPKRRLKEQRYLWKHIRHLRMRVVDSIYENESSLLEQCYIRKYRQMGYTLVRNIKIKNPESFPDYLAHRVSRSLYRPSL